VLFFVLRLLTHKQKKLFHPGFIAGAFAAGYASARIISEFFRSPDPQIGFLFGGATMGMVLSLPMLVIGIIVMLWAAHRREAT
ncbi:MAG: prolipoprotein diacylglyceryl transferase family protein, partial [Stappiaceae bacterium]